MEWKYWFDIDDNGNATMYHTSASGNGFKVHKCVSVTLVEQCILPLMDMLDAEVRGMHHQSSIGLKYVEIFLSNQKQNN